MVVCWHFDAAAALGDRGRDRARAVHARRSAATRCAAASSIKINWPGRLGVAPTMGAPFFAMAGVHWLALIMLYVGMALALIASGAVRPQRGCRVEIARPQRAAPNSQAELDPLAVAAAILAASRTPTRKHPEDLICMDTFPDLGSLTDQELKDLIKQLTDEEMEISYRRRILHGKIDILRAELVNRLRKKDETRGAGDLRRRRAAADRHPRRARPGARDASSGRRRWPSTAQSAALPTTTAPTTASAAARSWPHSIRRREPPPRPTSSARPASSRRSSSTTSSSAGPRW